MVKNEKIIVNAKSLNKDFSLFISSLIILVIFMMGVFSLFVLKNISKEIFVLNQVSNSAIATAVFQFSGKNLSEQNFDIISENITNMITNNLISYVVIKSYKTNKVVFSTISGLDGQIIYDEFALTEMLKKTSQYKGTYNIIGQKSGYVIYIGFYQTSLLDKYLADIKFQIVIFGIIFILLGILFASLMTKSILKPFKSIISGVKKISDGDFSHRLEMSDYIEINELLNACNVMAEKLQRIYATLETQVQQRTEELNQTLNTLKETQSMMLHSEKMKSLGELIAGLTHELNNPINFVYGNLIHLKNYAHELIEIISAYEISENQIKDEDRQKIIEIKNKIDFDFIKRDLPDLLHSCMLGMERTKNLISDLRNFSRMNDELLGSINVTKEIDTVLSILNSKITENIKIHKEYQNTGIMIDSYGGQLNQVFMNIIDNAISALDEKGNIWIRTYNSDLDYTIEIEDDGKGIEQENLNKVFEPFFTTKEVGKGTGLGLSIVYRIIKNHKGLINLDSKKGKGTKFIIKLPLLLEK